MDVMHKRKGQNYYTSRHSCYLLAYHLVLVTKYRHLVLKDNVKNVVYDTIKTILEEKGINLIQINGEEDHIHVLFEAAINTDLLQLVNVIKTKTSRFARSRCSEELSKYYWKPYFWSDSYFITTTGMSELKVVSEYIENQ